MLRNYTDHFTSIPISLAQTSDTAMPEVNRVEINNFPQEMDSSLWKVRRYIYLLLTLPGLTCGAGALLLLSAGLVASQHVGS